MSTAEEQGSPSAEFISLVFSSIYALMICNLLFILIRRPTISATTGRRSPRAPGALPPPANGSQWPRSSALHQTRQPHHPAAQPHAHATGGRPTRTS